MGGGAEQGAERGKIVGRRGFAFANLLDRPLWKEVLSFYLDPLPVLVGNNRVYSRCECWLVSTWQVLPAHLVHRPTGHTEEEQSPFDPNKNSCKHRLVTTEVAVSLIMINTEDYCSLSFW